MSMFKCRHWRIHYIKSYFGAWYNNGGRDANGKWRNWVKVWLSKVCVIWLYIVGLGVRSRDGLKLIGPISSSSTPFWSYLHSTVQVYTTGNFRFYREQLGPAPPNTGPGQASITTNGCFPFCCIGLSVPIQSYKFHKTTHITHTSTPVM